MVEKGGVGKMVCGGKKYQGNLCLTASTYLLCMGGMTCAKLEPRRSSCALEGGLQANTAL